MSTGVGRFITPEGVLVFTLTNNGYKYFTLNLVEHLKRAAVPWKLCIVCADAASYRFFQGQGITSIKASTLLPETGPEISQFGTVNFQRLNRKKLELLAEFLTNPAIKYGIYIDGDIAVYNDFVPDILGRFAVLKERLFLQCDEFGLADCSGCPCINGCTGFIAWSHGLDPKIFRVTADTIDLWRRTPEDQMFVNEMLRREGIPWRTLPRTTYPNGQFINTFRANPQKKGDTMLLHYNYTVGMDKQRKMKMNGDWITHF